MMQLRPYQSEAVTAIRREWSEGKQRTLLVLPTGGGKTVVMSKVAEGAVARGRQSPHHGASAASC